MMIQTFFQETPKLHSNCTHRRVACVVQPATHRNSVWIPTIRWKRLSKCELVFPKGR
jgi:hypothetical protein